MATQNDGYIRTAWIVLAITVALGLAETAVGYAADSTFLTKDGLEWGYGAAIVAIAAATYGRSGVAVRRGGFLSAAILAAGGLQGLYELVGSLVRKDPDDSFGNLAASAAVSLIGAAASAALLARFRRSDDPVVKASWLSARNDVLTSALTAVVTLITRATEATWIDTAVSALSVILSFTAAYTVVREAASLDTARRTGA